MKDILDDDYVISFRKLRKELGQGSDVVMRLETKLPKRSAWNAMLEYCRKDDSVGGS